MNELITLKDKKFKPYLSHQKIMAAVKSMAVEINSDLANEYPVFLPVLNGAFMFASDLLKEMTMPCNVSFIKLASYKATQSSGTVTELIGLNEEISGRTVVIIEDIVDSGQTLEALIGALRNKQVKQIKTVAALFKSASYKKEHKVDYVGFTIPDNFVVGYGMDYDGLGRNLKEIHVLA